MATYTGPTITHQRVIQIDKRWYCYNKWTDGRMDRYEIRYYYTGDGRQYSTSGPTERVFFVPVNLEWVDTVALKKSLEAAEDSKP